MVTLGVDFESAAVTALPVTVPLPFPLLPTLPFYPEITPTARVLQSRSRRRSEHGGDLSLVHVKGWQYRPAASMFVAEAALRTQIAACGVRELMRRTGLSQHTVEAIRDGRPVRRGTLQRVIAAIAQ